MNRFTMGHLEPLSPTSCLLWQHRALLSGCPWRCCPSTSGYSRGSSLPSAPSVYEGPATAATQSDQGGRLLAQTHPRSDQAEGGKRRGKWSESSVSPRGKKKKKLDKWRLMRVTVVGLQPHTWGSFRGGGIESGCVSGLLVKFTQDGTSAAWGGWVEMLRGGFCTELPTSNVSTVAPSNSERVKKKNILKLQPSFKFNLED